MITTLGEGAYGTVGKFIRLNDMKSVAIKIVKTDCFRNGLANLEVGKTWLDAVNPTIVFEEIPLKYLLEAKTHMLPGGCPAEVKVVQI